MPRTSTPRRRGDTCVARMTAAMPHSARAPARMAYRNIAIDRQHCGHRRAQFRGHLVPFRHRASQVAPLRASSRIGRRNAAFAPCARPDGLLQYRGRASRSVGATLVSPGRSAAISQFSGITAYTAQRNATDGSCRSGTGRHKWRPYVHCRASSRRNAAGTTGPPRRSAAISWTVCMSGACEKKRTAVRSCRRECLTLHLVSTAP